MQKGMLSTMSQKILTLTANECRLKCVTDECQLTCMTKECQHTCGTNERHFAYDGICAVRTAMLHLSVSYFQRSMGGAFRI